MKVLMVCLGNICRSPLAESILKTKVNSTIVVESAGTSGLHSGELPDIRSIEIAKKNYIDITNQRSRKFTLNDFEDFDLIYVMDKSNYENVTKLSTNKEELSKVKIILNECYPDENLDVPDPYYGGEQGFTTVFNMLDDACEVIASKINI